MVRNYANGKIYRIVCNTTGLQYVGSTTKQYLSQRLDKHRSAFKMWKSGKKVGYCTSFKVIENENYSIVLLECVGCKSKDELRGRERFHIENLTCVNKNIPMRTCKEWKETHREQLADYSKEWREKNKGHFVEQQKEYREKNKDQIEAKKREPFACECGSVIRHAHKARHFRTLKHQHFCIII